MSSVAPPTSRPSTDRAAPPPLLCPFDLRVEGIAAFVNCELDHQVYDGLELQWFDDARHGRGLLAFLSRRDGRLVDYYLTPGLRIDRTGYEIGGGTGCWVETRFGRGLLDVRPDGVRVDVEFHDRDGRLVEVALDDTAAGRRRTGELLAPVGAAIEAPRSLGLVLLQGFDLLRRTPHHPRIRIDGRDVPVGTLPGGALHRRHLIKAAGPLVVATLCAAQHRRLTPVDTSDPGPAVVTADGRALAGVVARDEQRGAELRFAPSFPPLGELGEDDPVTGTWTVDVCGRRITGGSWSAQRTGRDVRVEMEVTQPWRPRRLPPLLAVVTRVMPVFRRWPTSYRWKADVRLGAEPTVTSRWERTSEERGQSYRRATQAR